VLKEDGGVSLLQWADVLHFCIATEPGAHVMLMMHSSTHTALPFQGPVFTSEQAPNVTDPAKDREDDPTKDWEDPTKDQEDLTEDGEDPSNEDPVGDLSKDQEDPTKDQEDSTNALAAVPWLCIDIPLEGLRRRAAAVADGPTPLWDMLIWKVRIT
jgi:hypothetical protein